MANIVPIISVETGRPDYDGRVLRRAWWADLPVAPGNDNPSKSMRGVSRGPHQWYGQGWTYSGCMRVPEVGTILRPSVDATNETLARWVGSGSFKKVVRPSGGSVDWIKWYDAGSECPFQTSAWHLPADQPFQLTLRYAASTTAMNLRIGWDSGNAKELRFDSGADTAALYDNAPGGGVLEEYQSGAWGSFVREGCTEPRQIRLQVIPLEDYLVVYAAGIDTPIVYYERGLLMPAAPVRLQFGGGMVAWNLSHMKYPATGYVEMRNRLGVNTDVFTIPAAGTSRLVWWQSGGTSASVNMQATASTIKPRVTLSSAYPNRTPVLYMVQAGGNATITTPALALTDVTSAVDSLSITLREGRGSSAELTLRDFTAALSLAQNAKLTINGNWDTGGGETADQLQFEGRIMGPKPQQSGREFGGQKFWDISARSRADVLTRKKAMIRMPSFGGWLVSDMIPVVLNAAGFASGFITVTDDATLPGWKDERRFAFDDRTYVARALDEMLSECGLIWREVFQPSYAIEIVKRPVYTSGFEVTLTSTSDRDNIIREIVYHEDLDEYSNFVYMTAQERDGGEMRAYVGDRDSIETPGSTYYVGDWYERAEQKPDGYTPERYARELHAEAEEHARVLEWTWPWHPTLMPGDYVRCQVTSCGAPNNSVFRLTEKRITFELGESGLDAWEDCTGVRVA